MNIPISRPYFGEEEASLVLKPLETGWVVQGPYVKQFEDRFAAFTGAGHAAATTSCTTALHLAMAILQVKPGDEVIVPAFTWVATANVVELMGAKPVFCDIDLKTFNIDCDAIDRLITERTVGIIPVHLFGLCADMGRIESIAARHELWVVEDAACAFGAWYRGRHAGTMGEMGAFSFHPRKSITTGEGGMLTTAREDLDVLARCLRDHGASRSDLARHTDKAAYLLAEYNHLGFNYRMTDLQGALGCAQMDRAAWILDQRTSRARGYDEALKDVHDLALPTTPEGYVHGYQAYVTLFRPETPTLRNVEALHRRRNDVMSRLEAQGIATRQGTHAPVTLGLYRSRYGLQPEDYPNAVIADHLTLTLPLYAQMTDDEQQRVCESLKAEVHA